MQTVVVEADGSRSDELAPFLVEGLLPAAPSVTALEEDLDDLGRDALVLRWAEAEDAELPLTLKLTPVREGEAIGDDITCVFEDVGHSRIDLQELHALGFPRHADGLRITASRTATTTFDAGAFVGSELVVERRSRISVSLR
jgi:hypothetical protein